MEGVISTAREFALARHGDQRYGERPYEYHLSAVAEVMRRFGITHPVPLAAAWLHDVVEDTPTAIWEVEFRFGERVASLVWAVTDSPGANRAERKAATHLKIRHTPGAALLKAADRIANCEEAGKLGMYRREHPEFRQVLVAGGAPEPMLGHLDLLLAPCL